MALGYAIQNWRPLSGQTIAQLSNLLIETLLPLFLFFVTATTPLETLTQAPVGILLVVLITLLNYVVASLLLRPAGVGPAQTATFRFANMQTNNIFLGLPTCVVLFGPVGVVFAILYEFGKNLVVLTFGIWILRGGRFHNWRSFLVNPLIWSVIVGFLWSVLNWPFPAWATTPFESIGNATLPLALLVTGVQLRNLQRSGTTFKRQLVGFTLARLVITPVLIGTIFTLIDWHDTFTNILITQAAQPVGFTAVIFARNYEADAEFASLVVLWSTVAALVTVPLMAVLYDFI